MTAWKVLMTPLFASVFLAGCVTKDDGLSGLGKAVVSSYGALHENCNVLRLTISGAGYVASGRKLEQARRAVAAYCDGPPPKDGIAALVSTAEVIAAIRDTQR